MPAAVCRVCLVGDARMLCIDNSKLLQDTYEKLSSTKLKPGDARPEMLCYICYSQLQRCCKFMVLSQKSNKALSDLFQKGIEVTRDTITKRNLETMHNISIPPMQFTEINPNSKKCSADVYVKEEFIETEEDIEDADINTCFDYEQPLINECLSTVNKKDVDEQFLCEVCGGKFVTNSELAKHLLTHTEKMQNDTFNNEESCRKTSTSKRIVKKHKIKSSTAEKQYKCDSCEKSFTHKNTLKEHKRIHTGEKPYVCDFCNKSFIYKSYVRMHMRIHTGEKPYSCDICKKTFICKQSLKRHKINIHTKEKPHQCESCDRAFLKKNLLQIHTRTHTGQKPYICQICDKTFVQKKSLECHIKRIHIVKKPYGCDSCNKTFTLKNYLKIHMRVHTGERPYACNICNKAFAQFSNLKRHQRIHTGEKPYSCKICKKAFAQKNCLTDHMRIHDGLRHYTCHICLDTFNRSSHLTRHKQKHL